MCIVSCVSSNSRCLLDNYGLFTTFVLLELNLAYQDNLSPMCCRYDIASNRWWEETRVPREAPLNSSFGFVASDGELHIVTNLKKAIELPTDILRSRQLKKTGKLYIQIYNPKRKTWRSLVTKSPFNNSLDFNTAVLCNIRL